MATNKRPRIDLLFADRPSSETPLVSANSSLVLPERGGVPSPMGDAPLKPTQIREPKRDEPRIRRSARAPGSRARPPIRQVRRVPLHVFPLREQVRWWLHRHAERTSETWVLQPSLRGPVWRPERWADRHKETLAVAILQPLEEHGVE